MKETIQPYLMFGGRCEEALEFYKSTLGAKVEFMMRFNETPEPMPPDRVPSGWEKKICLDCLTTKKGPKKITSDRKKRGLLQTGPCHYRRYRQISGASPPAGPAVQTGGSAGTA